MNPALLALLGARVATATGALLTYRGVFGSGGGAPATVTIDIGAASATRSVVIVVAWPTTLVRDVTACTIGGVTATQDGADPSARTGVKIYRATVPTGTTADVVTTWNSAVGFDTFVFTADSALAVQSTAGTNTATTTLTGTLSATAAGGMMVAGYALGSGGTATAFGPFDTVTALGTTRGAGYAVNDGSAETITATLSGTPTLADHTALVAVAYAAA